MNGYSGSEFVSDMRAWFGNAIELSKANAVTLAKDAESFESLLEAALLHEQVVLSDTEGVERIVSELEGDESDEASEDRDGKADEEAGEEGGDGGDTDADGAEDDDDTDDEEDWDDADGEEDSSDDDELIAELVGE